MFDEVYTIAIESNDFEELKRKLKKIHIDAPSIKDGFFVTAAAQLAIKGKNNKVEWMRQLGANVDDIAYGYALAGNHERAEAYRTAHGANVDAIAYGYALVGNHERVETYRTEHGANVNFIVSGYARAGNHKRVEAYRTEHGANVDAIAYGYARAGNHERVEAYRTEHGAKVDSIAYGYARAGNQEKQKKYDINYLLNSYLKERTAVTDSSGKTKEYFHGSFFSVFQKSFTQKREAVNVLKSALEGNKVNLNEHLPTLRNGNLGKELRAFIKSGIGNALVGREVTTVSDFVQALQEKVSNQARLS
ncbi:hypothetical protein [Legionella cardiaca]|uniref:Ankyrin repeat protein n=1 Tax=Legionella cardiaca TaxID=1071983 RepID=A0ABY8AN33_9GAMM|nr:hypothetical protein [Legionella cardiaca]WED41978.1 hypothetical protein PXX05_08520 [Legionella cardiaca]